MRIMEYIKDKILLLVLHACCMLLLAGFLYATGYERAYCRLILIFWLLILTLWILYGYYGRRRYFQELEATVERMDKRYLLGELMPVSLISRKAGRRNWLLAQLMQKQNGILCGGWQPILWRIRLPTVPMYGTKRTKSGSIWCIMKKMPIEKIRNMRLPIR